MSPDENPIIKLVRARCQELGMSKAQLIQRLGYSNITKGLRRLQEIENGDVSRSAYIVGRLSEALDLSPQVVGEAAQRTRRLIAQDQAQLEAKEEAQWRERFRPHALIVPEKRIPSPIFVAALCGGPEKLLRIELDWSRAPVTYIRQALNNLPTGIPAFGRPVGVIINYSPDRAIRFDLSGKPLEIFSQALRAGRTSLHIRGRPIDERLLSALL